MRKEKIVEYLTQTNGSSIATAEDLVNALFYGEIKIFEDVPPYSKNFNEEYDQLSKLIIEALEMKYTKSETIQIIDRLNEIRALQVENQYKHCFQEGLKIGLVLGQIPDEK